MIDELQTRLSQFRDDAVEQGIAAEDVDRWLAAARPSATLARQGDGPVVGHFGGPLLLPADTPDLIHPFVATIDLAALPADATDLDLPADGHLLLFASPWDSDSAESAGAAVYVPAGTAVQERDKYRWRWSDDEESRELFERFPQGPLRATPTVSLPEDLGYSISERLLKLWGENWEGTASWGMLQLGGYGTEAAIGGNPVSDVVFFAQKAMEDGHWEGPISTEVSDWVLLADWHLDVTGLEGATMHWAIQRDDLAARRFDRTFASLYWNP
ncbi:DUF1963 domain-containing protein [Saccharothrix coeruleofusca]|uniref:DUF1963 domain-containing protein n=1 Tax=Saccharothrix coeruleofusca TaxID=33919 RepID=A0A918AUU0_9PSEU|nr:DUF1963 domain-containing protein [Saccharothrix coeruleofusca]MBP2338864.1 hypothetical protein [Saccharothrix coeruleofusca]GGP86880.1 hypothetical protein GCM10010185_70820 [Saccharothrix coeruleofusca]